MDTVKLWAVYHKLTVLCSLEPIRIRHFTRVKCLIRMGSRLSVVFGVEGSEDHDNKEHIDLNIQYKAERDKKQYKEGPPRWVSKRKSRSYCFGT